MPSPGTDGGAQESVPAPQKQTGIKLGCGLLLIFAILAGIVLWLAKPPAGPPIVASPPVGRLYFLMVNAASEHTAALRGLYTLGEGDKKPKLLMEEKESQGMEDAPRE